MTRHQKCDVGFLLSSASLVPLFRGGTSLLDGLKIPYKILLADGTLQPRRIDQWITNEAKDAQILIVGDADNRSGILPLTLACTHVPVIVVPVSTHTDVRTRTDQYSSHAVAFPQGAVSVGPEAYTDAVYAALQVLALSRKEVRDWLAGYRAYLIENLDEQNQRVQKELNALEPNAQNSGSLTATSPVPADPDEEAIFEELARDFRPEPPGVRRPQQRIPDCLPALDYSPELRQTVTAARDIAAAYGHDAIRPEHFLAAMLDSETCAAHVALQYAGARFEVIAENLEASFPKAAAPLPSNFFALDQESKLVLEVAKRVAREKQRKCLTTVDWLEGIIYHSDSVAAMALWDSGLTLADITRALAWQGLPEECLPSKAVVPPPPVGLDIDPAVVTEVEKKLKKKTSSTVRSERGADSDEGKSPNVPTKTATLTCDPYDPPVDLIEEAVDTLLDGKVLAFPTDTGYVLGVDATNRKAVARLFQITRRPEDRAVSVLVNSVPLMKEIVRAVPDNLDSVFDQFWPGPLTIVFEKHPGQFAAVSSDTTLGVRIPDSYLSLAVLSTFGRPIATVPALPHRKNGSIRAADVVSQYANQLDVIIDAGPSARRIKTTVLSVVEEPFHLLRPGAVKIDALKKVLGDRLTVGST